MATQNWGKYFWCSSMLPNTPRCCTGCHHSCQALHATWSWPEHSWCMLNGPATTSRVQHQPMVSFFQVSSCSSRRLTKRRLLFQFLLPWNLSPFWRCTVLSWSFSWCPGNTSGGVVDLSCGLGNPVPGIYMGKTLIWQQRESTNSLTLTGAVAES